MINVVKMTCELRLKVVKTITVTDHGLKREMHACRNQQISGDQAGKSAYRFVIL